MLTYTITDIDGVTFDQDVIVTVGDRAEVKELTDEGVWEAVTGITVTPSTGNTAKDITAPGLCFTPVKSSVSKGTSGSSKGNTGSTSANKGSADNKGNASNHGNTSNQGSSTEEGDEVHIHAYDNGVVTREATCTKPGEMTYTCTGCGETKTEEIPALGHTEDEGVITKEPTCTEAGEITYRCTRCGEVIRTKETPATGHSHGEGIVTKDPTCTEPGEMTFTCDSCGETSTEEIPALGHAEDEGEITKEPTCTEAGVITIRCTRCGEVIRTQEIPASDHAWIHHDEVGHYETVVIEEAYTEEVPIWKVVCNGCREEFDTADEAGNHIMSQPFDSDCQNYSSKIVGYETIEHPAVTEEVWVVDEEAYDECENCGERR